jgi:hypothetical protein
MNDNLPPLPEPDFAAWTDGDNGIPKITTGYRSETTLAYGQQCRQQALEEAAQRFERVGGMIDPRTIAAAIRALKEKT